MRQPAFSAGSCRQRGYSSLHSSACGQPTAASHISPISFTVYCMPTRPMAGHIADGPERLTMELTMEVRSDLERWKASSGHVWLHTSRLLHRALLRTMSVVQLAPDSQLPMTALATCKHPAHPLNFCHRLAVALNATNLSGSQYDSNATDRRLFAFDRPIIGQCPISCDMNLGVHSRELLGQEQGIASQPGRCRSRIWART